MNQNSKRLKIIQDLGLAFVALSVLFSPLTTFAQSKKYVKVVFDAHDTKSKKKRARVKNKYGVERYVASVKESPRHGNIVPIHDYVADVEALETPKKPIIKKNKKPLAIDAEISRDMVIAK